MLSPNQIAITTIVPKSICPICSSFNCLQALWPTDNNNLMLFECLRCHSILDTDRTREATPEDWRTLIQHFGSSTISTKFDERKNILESRGLSPDEIKRILDPLYRRLQHHLIVQTHDNKRATSHLPKRLTPRADHPKTDPILWSELANRIAAAPKAYSAESLIHYASDYALFTKHCQITNLNALPAETLAITSFIGAQIARPLAAATIRRRIASISFIHRMAHVEDPTKHPDVTLKLKDANAELGTRQNQQAPIRLTHDPIVDTAWLNQLLAATPPNNKGLRDKALLSVGFDIGVRGGELVSILVEDIMPQPDGTAQVFIKKAKNDQASEGSKRFISRQGFQDLTQWLEASNPDPSDYVFRRITAHDTVFNAGISRQTLTRIIKETAVSAGLPKDVHQNLSSHSMRIGHAQELFQAGNSIDEIMQSMKWKDRKTVLRYVEHLMVSKTASADFLRNTRR